MKFGRLKLLAVSAGIVIIAQVIVGFVIIAIVLNISDAGIRPWHYWVTWSVAQFVVGFVLATRRESILPVVVGVAMGAVIATAGAIAFVSDDGLTSAAGWWWPYARSAGTGASLAALGGICRNGLVNKNIVKG